MSTRRTESGITFDHGCQYFQAKSASFRSAVEEWGNLGVIAEWSGRFARLRDGVLTRIDDQMPRYVGTPTMSAVCRHLAATLDVRSQVRIESVQRQEDRWLLFDQLGVSQGSYDVVVCAIPPDQALTLLGSHLQSCDLPRGVEMTPCWSVMVAFAQPLEIPADGIVVENSPIAWAARNSSKPQRDEELDTWVVQASPQWSSRQLEKPPQAVASLILDEVHQQFNVGEPEPVHLDAHRWRYAIAAEKPSHCNHFDARRCLAICGDWCIGSRVESAYESGVRSAVQIVNELR